VDNLLNFVYPNGVTSAYSYDALNRLTQMGASKKSSSISNYAYTLGLAGNRLTVAELSGRSVAYGYDSLYRLTSEDVTSDPDNKNGTTSYTYDAVGNRQQLLLNGTTANTYTYDADDRLGSDQYDPDGNTVNSGGTANSYDFGNHMTQHGLVTLVYDGDGNRVSETLGGVTTNYLVDTQNPTGYAQVVDELQNGAVSRIYSYGLERISEKQLTGVSFYGYDGHGSVRHLTNSAGAVTDTYDYDAFGNLINSTGSTPNNYLFAGEQYDPALNLYYNRARYLSTITGRFWTMDSEEGDDQDPSSLHKYLYDEDNPINNLDPTGNEIDAVGALSISSSFDSISVVNVSVVIAQGIRQATTLSEQGLGFIAVEEGFRGHLYDDIAGHCTIGYGHLVSLSKCSKSAEASQYKMGITKPAAQNLLWQDAQDAIQGVRTYTSVALAQKEFDAITDFVFNEGSGNYQISDLRNTLNQGLYSLVPPLFLHFTRAGKYPNALLSRRQDEASLFTSGIYRARGQLIN
jgi:RHS repeat-associated protein